MNPFVQHSFPNQGDYYAWEQLLEEAPLVFDRFGEMDTQKELDALGVPFVPPVRWVSDDDEEATADLDKFEASLQGIYYDGPELDPYTLGEPTLVASITNEDTDVTSEANRFPYYEEPLPLTNNSVHSETSALQTQFQRKCSLEDATTKTTEDIAETMGSPPDSPYQHDDICQEEHFSLCDKLSLDEDWWENEVYERVVEVNINTSEIMNHSASPKTKRKQKVGRSNKRQRTERPKKAAPAPAPASSGIALTDIDVLAGRGGGSNNHVGNAQYWEKVLEWRDEYQAVHARDHVGKNRIARIVLDFVHGYGGRFLKNDKTKGIHEMSEKDSLEKIKQALRDDYVPQFFTA